MNLTAEQRRLKAEGSFFFRDLAQHFAITDRPEAARRAEEMAKEYEWSVDHDRMGTG